MRISALLCCLLWAAISSISDAQSPSFLISAPRRLHLGVSEDVWLQLEWPPGVQAGKSDVAVELYLRNQLTYRKCSETYTVTLSQRNGYISKQTIEITPQMETGCNLDKSASYVQLVANSKLISAKLQVVSIPVSNKRGYIFIQTDKSIYTPNEKVKFRVFTLDHMMRPAKELTTCIVSNAEGLKVASFQKISSLIADSIQIPDISTTGVWKISAYYNSAPGSNFTSEFEVRKYVLPNFEVKIIPELPYFLVSGKEFKIKVEASYVYGKPVSGITYVRLGIIDQDGQKTILQGLEQNVKLTEGEGTVTISKEAIVKKIGQPEENLVGSTFYIAVSVMEAASGTLEEKEMTSVKFVTSPYILDLSKTRRYFTPGMPVTIVAEVTHTDGSPAPGVMVKLFKSNVEQYSFPSGDFGVRSFTINTQPTQKSFEVKVTAGEAGARQEETLILTSYNSKTNSFLYLEIPDQILSPGENVKITMKVAANDPGSVKKIYYMILNKGRILDLQSIDRVDVMVVNVAITSKMVPSFRIVAYYYLGSEIVANSVWVDITDVCEGKLQLRTNVVDSILPGRPFQLTIETDGKTAVSLSAVDTAVYLLNSKNKLTPSKVYKAMNAYDLGCSSGSGKDYKSVFIEAGLAFVSSVGYSDMKELSCKVSQRKKRSLDFSVLAMQKVNKFQNQTLKQCCMTGMKLLPPRMEKKCETRASRIGAEDCRTAFIECCKYAEELRKKIQANKRKDIIGRTQEEEEEDDFTDESDVQVRSSFPESWLWRTIDVNKKHSENIHVHDSLTTWEIQGVGMSEGQGFCVAEPIKVKVFKEFHVHLRVPYSVKRFEQMELRPVLYNYYEQDLKVKVFLEKTEDLCSATTAEGEPVEQTVTVPSKSAISIPFVVVPIGKSNPIVTVKAVGPHGIADGVKKPLRILREGVTVVEEKTYIIDPKNRRRSEITVDEDFPSNMIPDGDFHASIKMSVDSPMNTINNSLSSDGVSRLIRVPYGCAEQTMISTAPGVYAMRYLDHTDKWMMLPPDRKDDALENMKNGYSRILQYRKKDGSYGAWLTRPSSTWLTAFVVKVISLCRKYIDVDVVEEIKISATYLTTQQSDTGAFLDNNPVIHKDMMGGVAGKTADVSLTSYVLVALHLAKDAMPEDDTKVKRSIAKAIDYIRSMLENIKEPYSLAVTAYALNLASSDSFLKDKAYTNLMFAAQEDRNKDTIYFGPAKTALAVEATAYALLTALLQNDLHSAKKMYAWLSEQENYGGGFKSTQDTVMALEALSEYWIKTHTSERNELRVVVNSLERSLKQEFILRSEESIQEELRSMGTKFKVKVSGKGTGVLKVLKMYNIIEAENTTCSQLELAVKVDGDTGAGKNDDEDYDYGDEGMSDEPLRGIDWHDLRSRTRREVSQPKEKVNKVIYEVCLRRKSQTGASGMAIVDITLLSGFEPSAQDLNKLKDGIENYISHYEIRGGRLIMYFDSVSNTRECVTFEAVQTVTISPLQPASAILYDFYEPENQCRVFYGGPDKSTMISTLCSGDVCQCAEGSCPKRQRSQELKGKGRQDFACYSPRVVFGYSVNVLDIKVVDAFTVYTVNISEVLQKHSDEAISRGEIRYFYQRSSCKMQLSNKEYLIMGQDGQTQDEKGRMRYLLESNSWIEELAGPQVCKATRHRNACNEVKNFMDDYRENGCRS
ncbi:complement C4-like isoform X1 [Phyllobates terribilis]|uniref:complement C4-like isoform X1 n=1 Tax=Phyllobates terribilis TaxID=111132 RepID=UPI003CCB1E8C